MALSGVARIQIRKAGKNRLVEAIIILPNMFYTTDISVTLDLITTRRRAVKINDIKRITEIEDEVLFMDLVKKVSLRKVHSVF